MNTPAILWGMDPLLHVPMQLMIAQVKALKRMPDQDGIYQHHSHPVRAVEILGVVQMVHRATKRILYNLDDGTGAIPCLMWIPDQYLAVQDMSNIPSLLPHQLGQVVKIVGRPSDFRGSIQITFEPGNSVVCTDPNDETVFRLRVLKLEKDVYSRPVVLPDIVLQEARMRKDLKADVTLASLLDHLRAWTTGRKVQEFEFIEMLDNEQNRLFARHVVQTETPSLLPDETEKQVRSMMVKCLGQLVKEGTIETIDVEEMTFRVARRTIAREVVEQDAAGKSRKVVLLDDDDDDDDDDD